MYEPISFHPIPRSFYASRVCAAVPSEGLLRVAVRGPCEPGLVRLVRVYSTGSSRGTHSTATSRELQAIASSTLVNNFVTESVWV